MAQGDDNKPTAEDKGKGKAATTDTDGVDAMQGIDDPKKELPGKTLKDGEKADTAAEELSEEDKKLKEELEMLVERIQESDEGLQKSALEAIKDTIKTSTSSMTAVPKPLKFLRPHFEGLEKTFESWPDGDNKKALAEVLSVLGMTHSDESKLASLNYKLLAPKTDLGSWGHEYVRHLALELGQEYQNRLNELHSGGADDWLVEDLITLADDIVPFFTKHNSEADAVDLLSEIEGIVELPKYLDKDTFERVCLYMVSMVPLLTFPDNVEFLKTAHEIYNEYNRHTQAMTLAIKLHDIDLIKSDLFATEDKLIRKQMAFQVARQRIWLDVEDQDDDPELADCLNNTKLPDHFKALGKELNILDPRSIQDIYKTHLESSRTATMTNMDSAKHNLAGAFVNGFVNAGFGNDKLMLVEEGSSWVWKTKEDGMISTAASVGLLQLWDTDNGLTVIDRYINTDDDWVKAGAYLAVGVVNAGIREPSEPAMALLGDEDVLNHKKKEVRISAIMGLGLAYAGTAKEELLAMLLPYVADTSLDMQISAMAALSLGMIFIGSSNADISEAIVQTFFDEDRTRQLKDKWTRFMALGLALLYFGRQEEVDVIVETLDAIDHPMSKPSTVLCEVCAWAGTGSVLKIQELLHICNEHIEEDSDEKENDKDDKDETQKSVDGLLQAYAVIGLSLVAMGEDVGQEMILRQFGHLMHYGEANIRRAVPLAMGLISPSNPQMKIYDTLSRYSHDNDNDVAVNAIFAMGLVGAGTNNARLAQLLRQLASYYSRDPNSLFMVRIAQGLLHMGKGTMTLSPFHTERQVMSRIGAAGLLTVLVSLIDAKQFILADSHYLLYYLVTSMFPRFLVTLDEDLKPIQVNVRVGQAVDVVGQAGRPKTITGWQTQSTPVVLAHGERAELEDEKYIALSKVMEGLVILKKNPEWTE